MEIGIAIFVIFAVALGFFLFRYENPSQSAEKLLAAVEIFRSKSRAE